MEKPYKVIVSLANLELDAILTTDLKCIIQADKLTKESDVPFREVYCFDLSHDCDHMSVTFKQKGVEIADGTFYIPQNLNSLSELEIIEKFKLPIKNVTADLQYLQASFNLTYINTSKFEESLVEQSIPPNIEKHVSVPQDLPSNAVQVPQTKKLTNSKGNTANQTLGSRSNNSKSDLLSSIKTTPKATSTNSKIAGVSNNKKSNTNTSIVSSSLQDFTKSLNRTKKPITSSVIEKLVEKPIHTKTYPKDKYNRPRDKTPVSTIKKPHESPQNNAIITKSKVATANPATKKTHIKEPIQHNDTELDGYLNKIIDRHMKDTKKKLEADTIDTNDCVYLNKFDKLTNSDLINPELVSSPKRIKPLYGVVMTSHEEAQANIEETHSPTILKAIYQSGGIATTQLTQSQSLSTLNNTKRHQDKNSKANIDMTTILMDNETKRYVNEYKNQLEYLRMMIYNLDQKAQVLETCTCENQQLRDELEKSSNVREELRKSLQETTQDLREESCKFNKVISELETHNKDTLGSLKETHILIDDMQTQIHRLEIRNSQQENENSELKLKGKNCEAFKNQLEQLRLDYENSEKRHAESLNSLSNQISGLENDGIKLNQGKSTQLDLNKDLELENCQLRSELITEKGYSANLQNDLENINLKLKVTQTSVELQGSIQDQRDTILKDLSKLRIHNESSVNQMESLEKELIMKNRDLEETEIQNREGIARLMNKLQHAEVSLNSMRSENNCLKKDNIELKTHIITIEQLLCVKEDVYAQLQSGMERLETKILDCDLLKTQVQTASRVNENREDKIFELQKCLIYLKNVVQDKDEVFLLL